MKKRNSPIRQRLGALALLSAPLLTYPLLSVPEGEVAGIPKIFIYLFGVWGAMIGLAVWVAESRTK